MFLILFLYQIFLVRSHVFILSYGFDFCTVVKIFKDNIIMMRLMISIGYPNSEHVLAISRDNSHSILISVVC